MLELDVQEESIKQLRASRIEKDSLQRDTLINAITDMCDPFSLPATNSDFLLNITTGKAVSKTTQKYLTESLVEGHKLRVMFQEECKPHNQRFLKPIKIREVFNFAKENLKKKYPRSKKKSAAESQRDGFICILVIISKKMNFNLRYTLSFPITEFPLSISQSDGSGIKTDKSKLLRKLEDLQSGFTNITLPPIDVTLIDGGLLMHSLLSVIGKITSYGDLARIF